MILSPVGVDRLLATLRIDRDTAMVTAMLLGELRRCEVLGLRVRDVDVAARRVFIVDGKGGRQRHVNVSRRFVAGLADYLDRERPETGTDRLIVVLKGPAPRAAADSKACLTSTLCKVSLTLCSTGSESSARSAAFRKPS
jgi:integrase/recombinase XerD